MGFPCPAVGTGYLGNENGTCGDRDVTYAPGNPDQSERQERTRRVARKGGKVGMEGRERWVTRVHRGNYGGRRGGDAGKVVGRDRPVRAAALVANAAVLYGQGGNGSMGDIGSAFWSSASGNIVCACSAIMRVCRGLGDVESPLLCIKKE